jgi:ADP-ribose pyrophosphatase YjhB (NUDIX family)
MIIFINDCPIRLISEKSAQNMTVRDDFDRIIDARLEMLKTANLSGHVLILNATTITAEKLFQSLNNFENTELQAVTVVVKDKEAVEKRVKKMYSIVKAAGGVVVKGDRLLLMHRRGVWDLPKGKLDDNEKSKKAAVREVEEETGVKAKVIDKICTTWHTYKQGNERVLKRTKWYLMRCIDDTNLQPQTTEDIDELSWVTENQARLSLVNSYSSIRYVFDCFVGQEVSLDNQ